MSRSSVHHSVSATHCRSTGVGGRVDNDFLDVADWLPSAPVTTGAAILIVTATVTRTAATIAAIARLFVATWISVARLLVATAVATFSIAGLSIVRLFVATAVATWVSVVRLVVATGVSVHHVATGTRTIHATAPVVTSGLRTFLVDRDVVLTGR